MLEGLLPTTRPTIEIEPWVKVMVEPERATWVPFAGTRYQHPDVYFGKQGIKLERQPAFDMFIYTEPRDNHQDLVIIPQKGVETAWVNDLDWWI